MSFQEHRPRLYLLGLNSEDTYIKKYIFLAHVVTVFLVLLFFFFSYKLD